MRCNDKHFETDVMTTFLYTVYGSAIVLHHATLTHLWMMCRRVGVANQSSVKVVWRDVWIFE